MKRSHNEMVVKFKYLGETAKNKFTNKLRADVRNAYL
jgi:hypothetical protein